MWFKGMLNAQVDGGGKGEDITDNRIRKGMLNAQVDGGGKSDDITDNRIRD